MSAPERIPGPAVVLLDALDAGVDELLAEARHDPRGSLIHHELVEASRHLQRARMFRRRSLHDAEAAARDEAVVDRVKALEILAEHGVLPTPRLGGVARW